MARKTGRPRAKPAAALFFEYHSPMPPKNKKPFRNRMNDLDPKAWIKFQKSWFIHNPPPRKKNAIRHPGKFPGTLAEEFIRFFTRAGETVLDPMVGTGSTVVAAVRGGRHGYGVELNPDYVRLAREAVAAEQEGRDGADGLAAEIIEADAGTIPALFAAGELPPADYILTSPPYWDMLHARGAATQRVRRRDGDLDVAYSTDGDPWAAADLGNLHDYDEFLDRLVAIYTGLHPLLRARGYMTVIVKNVKKGGRIYPLAWDLARRLDGVFTLKDEKIWLQDNIRLAPYGMGNAWVSNTHHHYCLQFRKE
ncbi:MAG TPA: class I SAM-dependent methyltransferase [Anaerolineales bacterium]|nr:class I SAM-dependent methyltransferase [Anaerolineales bacterium]